MIKHGPWAHNQCQLQEFKIVYDKNPDWQAGTDLEGSNKMCLDPIRIEGNTIDSKAIAYMSYQNIPDEDATVGEINPTFYAAKPSKRIQIKSSVRILK
ncbi:MAG: hypothetical protein ACI30R_01415 [Sodaliphilus sp.]